MPLNSAYKRLGYGEKACFGPECCSVAPVEVPRAASPERLVERGALDALDGVLAGPGQALGAKLRRRFALQGLLDTRLFLALEQRMVVEWIPVQVVVDRHVAVELGVLALELEMLADGPGETGLRVDRRELVVVFHRMLQSRPSL